MRVTFEDGDSRATIEDSVGVSATLQWAELKMDGTPVTVQALGARLEGVGGGPGHADAAEFDATFICSNGTQNPFSEL